MSMIRFKARAFIGTATLADGWDVLRHPDPHEAVAAPLTARLSQATGREFAPAKVVRATGWSQTIGGALIATSVAPRLGALAALTATVPALLFGYRFWEVKEDAAHRAALRQGFFYHLTLAGAALLILAGPTGSKRRRQRKSAKTAS